MQLFINKKNTKTKILNFLCKIQQTSCEENLNLHSRFQQIWKKNKQTNKTKKINTSKFS